MFLKPLGCKNNFMLLLTCAQFLLYELSSSTVTHSINCKIIQHYRFTLITFIEFLVCFLISGKSLVLYYVYSVKLNDLDLLYFHRTA